MQSDNLQRVEKAIALLRKARDLLKTANSRKTLRRVRSALRSADGARPRPSG